MRTAPFLIFIIGVGTRIVKRALLSYAASRKISSAEHKAACIFSDTDGSPDAFCRIPLYSDALMLHLTYRVPASFYGHFSALSVLFSTSKMHISVFLELPAFSRKLGSHPMHSTYPVLLWLAALRLSIALLPHKKPKGEAPCGASPSDYVR